MAICPPKKIDSNITGLRIAKERCLGQLPANPTWKQQEPNSYSDFGRSNTTTARNPINPSRQRKKGVITDLEASGGYNQDLTIGNTFDNLQGFLFADARERGTTDSLVKGHANVSAVDGANAEYEFNNRGAVSAVVTVGGTGYRVGDLLTYSTGAQVPHVFYVTAVSGVGAVTSVAVDDAGIRATDAGGALAVTGGSGAAATLTVTWGDVMPAFKVGDIILASGFSTAANNGIKNVDSYATGVIGVSEVLVAEAAPPTAAKVQTVGFKFGAAALEITMNGLLPRLTDAGAFVDFTTMGFIAGEWIYLDGFANNVGFARIGSISADYLEFDKVDWTPVVEAETGITVSIYYGTVIRNESDPALIKRTSYQVERTLGQDTNGTMSEVLIGSVANEFTMNVAQADKVTVDLTFIGITDEKRNGLTGVKAGSRPALEVEDAYNTSSDFSRIKMALVSETDPAPVPLFAFATDMTLTINNNASNNKAIGILGGFDSSAGTFEVGGSITAYFSNIESVEAVNNNDDVTLDFIIVKNQRGFLVDVPLLALGNGRLTVEQDQAVMLPLDTAAAESKFGNTLLVQVFPYLPVSAG